MKRKVKKIIKKYKLSIIIAVSIFIIGIVAITILNSNSSLVKKYETETYVLKYAKSWKIKTKDNNKIYLKNGSKAKLNIEIVELQDEARYSEMENIIEEVVYSLEKQNKNYNMISQKEVKLSKYELSGYKLLYENKDSQVITALYKKGDKIVVFNYEAKNNYFDILLDSVNNIIYNFDVKEKKYDLSNKIKLNTTELKYTKDNEIDEKIEKTKEYEVASNNYYVKYTMPTIFELSSLASNYNSFNLKDDLNYSTSVYVSILPRNIFEYLDENNDYNVYNYKKVLEDDKEIYDYKDSLSKIEDKQDAYIYKYSYKKDVEEYNKDLEKEKKTRVYEGATIVFALNKSHIFSVEIKTKDIGITEKMIDKINIKESKNILRYTPSEKDEEYIKSELKRYKDYNKEVIEQVIINVPNKYKEYTVIDNNIYEERYFGLNYDEEKELYDYTIHYKLTSNSTNLDSTIDIINMSIGKNIGEYKDLTYSSDLTLSEKNFSIYDGGYTELGGIMFTDINRFKYYINKKVLAHELPTGGYLIIEISGNGKEITDSILNDATNFQLNEIKN